MGVFEMPNFAMGTRAIAEALAQATANGATTIVGGGRLGRRPWSNWASRIA
jgi:phosphoglycerate kinase